MIRQEVDFRPFSAIDKAESYPKLEGVLSEFWLGLVIRGSAATAKLTHFKITHFV